MNETTKTWFSNSENTRETWLSNNIDNRTWLQTQFNAPRSVKSAILYGWNEDSPTRIVGWNKSSPRIGDKPDWVWLPAKEKEV